MAVTFLLPWWPMQRMLQGPNPKIQLFFTRGGGGGGDLEEVLHLQRELQGHGGDDQLPGYNYFFGL